MAATVLTGSSRERTAQAYQRVTNRFTAAAWRHVRSVRSAFLVGGPGAALRSVGSTPTLIPDGSLYPWWAIARLDLLAALADRKGDFSMFSYFLPAVALIQPNGSLIELCIGSAAALIAAFGLGSTWRKYSAWRRLQQTRPDLDRPALRHSW